jgi:uncharacterized protein YjlB
MFERFHADARQAVVVARREAALMALTAAGADIPALRADVVGRLAAAA